MQTSNESISYIPQLDGLRAFAVFLVLIWHWLPDTHILNILPTGPIGVDIFFVLSGFLITKILLHNKEKYTDKKTMIRSFFLRRALRIFPIYYLVIFLTYFSSLLSSEAIENNFAYFFFYFSNFYFYIKQGWEGIASHSWSLAVEEQFYMFWPFLILFVSTSKLRLVFFLTIILGVIFRCVFSMYGDVFWAGRELYYVLTPTCLDSFGLGALLSYYQLYASKESKYRKYLTFSALISMFIIFIGFLVKISGNEIEILFDRFFISMTAVYLIMIASEKGFKGIIASFLNNRFLTYIGKISYGIYLFHPFTHHLYRLLHLSAVENDLRIPILNIILFPDIFVIHVVIVVVISAASWEYFEKPINSLKNKFVYGNKKDFFIAKA